MDSTLISFLNTTDAYPHNPATVTHVQTHISHVFIAPPYVYKFKKAVDFGFLDYSTLEKRHEFCQREVTLNRRLSEEVYLGVVAVCENNGFYIDEEPEPEAPVVEYAVKMRKLPEEYFLHTYLENDTLSREHLDRVADKLAHFYRGQEPDREVLQYGEIESIKVNTDENFEQTRDFIGSTIDEKAYRAIQYFTNQYFEQRAALFEGRIDQKRIVDGHGDLHLEHIHITPDQVQIYDCIEFNDRFRYGDLAADLAFLAMDLDFNDRWNEERYFIGQMAKKLDDPELPDILDFYKCYRAYVKGKVKSLQGGEEEVPKAERKQARDTARRYFNLSLRYALIGSAPKALIFMGGVGTGKSTLARHLADTLDIERLSSDRIRKTLAGLPLEQRTPAEERTELYSREMSERTYQKLMNEMERYLSEGQSVVLDATFNSRQSRAKIIERLEQAGADYHFVEATAPEAVIKERLRRRDGEEGVVSDARLEDYEVLRERYEAPDELEPARSCSVSTDCPLNDTLLELYRCLADANIGG